MTEAEWLACTSPEDLLLFLKGKVSDRKLRLFACACCRRISYLLDGWSRNAVEVAERYIDGVAGQTEMARLMEEGFRIVRGKPQDTAQSIAPGIVTSIITGAAWPLGWNTVSDVRRALRETSPSPDTFQESKAQAVLVREIIGNPFRRVTRNPDLLKWSCDALPKMARKIYDERAFELLPILADALQEAGCRDQQILDHCRGPGPHVRGCFVVDLLLGRE